MKELVRKVCIKIRNRVVQIDRLDKKIYSLILYGSIVRNDFIQKVSDIDFFVVVIDDDIVSRLREILLEECKVIDAYEVDLAWEYLENLDDPLNKGYPFKFLTIYQEDFIKNHILIYGEDITNILPRYDTSKLVMWRCKFLLKLANQYMGNTKMLHIIAGETVRLMAWIRSHSLHKDVVLQTLLKIRDKEAIEIYKAYLNQRHQPYTDKYLISFIKTRLNKILSDINSGPGYSLINR